MIGDDVWFYFRTLIEKNNTCNVWQIFRICFPHTAISCCDVKNVFCRLDEQRLIVIPAFFWFIIRKCCHLFHLYMEPIAIWALTFHLTISRMVLMLFLPHTAYVRQRSPMLLM